MDINARFRSNIRTFYSWIGSMALLAAAPMIGRALIERGTLGARIAGVALAVAATLPWFWVVLVIIRREDEFARRIHLTALASAFVGANIELVILHWLVQARFIEAPSLLIIWFTFMVQWLIAIFAAKRYYEREA